MLPFYVNGIWLSGSEGRRQLCEKCPELLLSHSCFNSSGGGRGNSSMYVHSLLRTWHGRRNNVFQLSEWLPEQSTYSTGAPQPRHWSWGAVAICWNTRAAVLCDKIITGCEFRCLWWLVMKRLRKQLEGNWRSRTWFLQNLIHFTLCWSSPRIVSFEKAYRGYSIHHLRISASENLWKQAFQWAETLQTWKKVIIIRIPSPWLISLNLAGTQIRSRWKMQPWDWDGHHCIRSSCSGCRQLVVSAARCGRPIALWD